MDEEPAAVDERLCDLLRFAGLSTLQVKQTKQFSSYLSLILRWNARLNLTAVRDTESILSRHFVESIACARALPTGIRTLLDFGSGAGFPGIPIAICRPEIAITLAESHGKKAAFLQEAVRTLSLSAKVHTGRAEVLISKFDCVTLRAVDKMDQAVNAATRLVAQTGWLSLMTTAADASRFQSIVGPEFRWQDPIALAGSERRILALGQKIVPIAE
jgi:16S rRNA (guanine527-N7)-methyltransferase